MKAYIINDNECYKVSIAPNGICTHVTQIKSWEVVPTGVKLGKFKYFWVLPIIVKLPGRANKHILRIYTCADHTIIYEQVLPDQPQLVSDITPVQLSSYPSLWHLAPGLPWYQILQVLGT